MNKPCAPGRGIRGLIRGLCREGEHLGDFVLVKAAFGTRLPRTAICRPVEVGRAAVWSSAKSGADYHYLVLIYHHEELRRHVDLRPPAREDRGAAAAD